MTEFNWNNFINELKKFQKGIENIGGHIRETKIEAPAKEEEILEVEKKLGYSRNTLYSMKDKKPNAERVSEIADYFQVSTDYLLGRTDEPSIARKFYHDGKEINVEQLASTAMRFNGKPLTEEDKKAIQNIIEIYLSK